MSETCTKAILDRFASAIHLILKPHPSGSQLYGGDLGKTRIDALSIDLYNSRGYVRLEVSTSNDLVNKALTQDFTRCYAKVYYHNKEFMEGAVIDLQILRWSKDKCVVQVDMNLTITEEEWGIEER